MLIVAWTTALAVTATMARASFQPWTLTLNDTDSMLVYGPETTSWQVSHTDDGSAAGSGSKARDGKSTHTALVANATVSLVFIGTKVCFDAQGYLTLDNDTAHLSSDGCTAEADFGRHAATLAVAVPAQITTVTVHTGVDVSEGEATLTTSSTSTSTADPPILTTIEAIVNGADMQDGHQMQGMPNPAFNTSGSMWTPANMIGNTGGNTTATGMNGISYPQIVGNGGSSLHLQLPAGSAYVRIDGASQLEWGANFSVSFDPPAPYHNVDDTINVGSNGSVAPGTYTAGVKYFVTPLDASQNYTLTVNVAQYNGQQGQQVYFGLHSVTVYGGSSTSATGGDSPTDAAAASRGGGGGGSSSSKLALPLGAIIGIAAGGGAAVIAALALLIFCCCRRRKNKANHGVVTGVRGNITHPHVTPSIKSAVQPLMADRENLTATPVPSTRSATTNRAPPSPLLAVRPLARREDSDDFKLSPTEPQALGQPWRGTGKVKEWV